MNPSLACRVHLLNSFYLCIPYNKNMWSKNKLKFVRSLTQKKYREAEGAFLAEGPKVVTDMAGRFGCRLLAATPDFLAAHGGLGAREVVEISAAELEQASALRAPREVLAVFDLPDADASLSLGDVARGQLVLALDGVQDPGNLGTIIRLADWFGVEHIFCSPDTADAFAPKVVQATMGALARVSLHYADLVPVLSALPAGEAVYGTFMDGRNLYETPLTAGGVVVMGNEGNGIRPAVENIVNCRLHIPSFPAGRPTSESLNVAMATAIVLAEFRRR